MPRVSRRPAFDHLEGRALMAGSPPPLEYVETPEGPVALIHGTRKADLIGVVAFPRMAPYLVFNNAAWPLREGTNFLYIHGGDGNDIIFNACPCAAVIQGGDGDDWLGTFDTTIGRGENVVYGGTGRDTFYGDTLLNRWVEEPDPFQGFTVDILGSVIVLGLTDADNTVEIDGSFARIDRDSGLSWPEGVFTHLVIDGQDGDDRVTVEGSDVQVIFYGDQGRDTFATDSALDIFYASNQSPSRLVSGLRRRMRGGTA